jgi:hypothetical protein
MSANVSATAGAGKANWNKNDQSWRHNDSNKADVIAATFDYNWDLLADGKGNKSSLTKQKKFNTVTDGRGRTHIVDKTWPGSPQAVEGTLHSKAWASFQGRAVVHHNAWWNHWEVFTEADVDTKLGTDGGSASATASITDPWRQNFPATGSASIHNLIFLTIGFGGSFSGGGIGFKGSMGEFGVSVNNKGKRVSFAKLNAGWKMYLNVSFNKRQKSMPIPKQATTADVRAALLTGFNPATQSWKSGSRKVRITFTKDLGSKASKASYKVGFSASN